MPQKTSAVNAIASIKASIVSLSREFNGSLRKIESAVASLAKSAGAVGTTAKAVKRGVGRPARTDAEAKCLVGPCHRRSVAKKLCPVHYRKAGHLKYAPPFSKAQLANLAKDGRATRWQKAGKRK